MNAAGLHFGHGSNNAIDESAALVLHSLHLPPDLPDGYFDAALTESEQVTVEEMLQRRIRERKPAAYVMQRAWFMDLPFYVDERVLIPRSPIAELIEQQFAPWIFDPGSVDAILDLCTGSGCIGIACAHAFESARVTLSDISAEALTVAQRNVSEHELNERVEVVQSDLFAALGDDSYDLIVSNPPYVSRTEFSQLPTEYRHEPSLALEAGELGLDFVVAILRHALEHLTDNGLLVMEVGNSQHALMAQYPQIPFVWLEFEHGGEGVFLLTATELDQFADEL